MTGENFREKNANSLIRDMRTGILILKADNTYPNDPSKYEVIDLNRSVTDMMGTKHDRLIGRKIADIIKLKPKDLEILGYVMNTGNSQQFEYYVERLKEWLLITVHHSRNDFLTITFENITEKKEMEEKLIQSEQTMSLTLDVTGEGVWEWTIDGKVKHNKQWSHILGLDDQERFHTFDDYMELVHPEDREKVMMRIHEAMEMEEVFHHEYRMIHKDGSTIWVEDRGVAVVDEDGHFERMIGSMSEITHYVVAQRNLSVEKELLKSTLLSVGDGILATDVNANITIMNPVAEELSGWEQSEAFGQHIEKIFPMIDQDTEESIYCFKTEESPGDSYKKIQNIQASFINREGEEFVMNCSISPIRLSDNKLTGFVITFRDITEVVAYQKEIEYMSYHDELTGLYNRRYMQESLKRLDTEENLPLTIMLTDINNLKETNDRYGHAVGDHLIKMTASFFKKFFHEKGIVSRTGGDEFVILLPKTTSERAEQLMIQLQAEMKNYSLKETPLTLAVGYESKSKPNEDVAQILRMADDKMYQNKRASKGL